MKKFTALVLLLCIQWTGFAVADEPEHEDVTFPDDSVDPLATLKPDHPRLIATNEQFDAMTKNPNDPLQIEVNKRVLASAEATLNAPLIKDELNGPEHTLLTGARSAFQRILICSMAYRMTHDTRFSDRAKKEMLNVAGFKDWNPAHFLDTAEMAAAVAIGYDWCFDTLSPDERQTIKQALMDKALVFVPMLYEKHETDRNQVDKRLWWVLSPYNWNLVCNGGMLAAALAIADEEPKTAREVVQGVRAYMPIALHSYAPDGAWPEGPVYWAYGTGYAVLALSMLHSALGNNFGIHRVEPAFAETVLYDLQMHSPNGLLFNYGDAHDDDEIHGGVKPCFGWLAHRFNLPVAEAAFRDGLEQEFKRRQANQESSQYFPLNALWLPAEPTNVATGTPLDAHYRGQADVAVFRSAWNDPDALYLGFKNGQNGVNHAHLDLGSFVMDSDGVRWSAIMGSDSYGLPQYFGKLRWTYFRLNNYGQSTITPAHILQDSAAVAPIISFQSTPDLASAVADLTPAYPGAARKMIRGVFLQNRARVLVQDDITGLASDTPLNWQMVTQATISISDDGHTATLTRDNKTLRVELLSPPDAKFSIASAVPPTPQEAQNAGYSILLGTVPPNPAVADVRLAVLLTPVGPKWSASLPAPQLQALPTSAEPTP